ncbi:DUF2268 domain-containing protein [Neobacillus sp. D3-1R]|uniref:DUF2268 domain-containing protein n=1 Tax=Neobacillus sp. D3-1R TaxID=3445778 RepID=UPI003F9FFDF3
MGVERTDIWLRDSFEHPIEMCKKMSGFQNKSELQRFYQYLVQFGMYRPNSESKNVFEELKKGRTWDQVQLIYSKYKEDWKGPKVPIYIFPIDKGSRLLFRSNQTKSGVSFKDKIFLFLSNLDDSQELEALIIHEYHHVCRMNGLTKPLNEYTLLDSIIMEGLAEDAVHEHLGKKYVASWSKELPNEQFNQYWQKYFKKHLSIKKKDSLHDHLLFGKGFVPKMLGYTCGYHIVRKYRKHENFSTKASFSLVPEIFIKKFSEEA